MPERSCLGGEASSCRAASRCRLGSNSSLVTQFARNSSWVSQMALSAGSARLLVVASLCRYVHACHGHAPLAQRGCLRRCEGLLRLLLQSEWRRSKSTTDCASTLGAASSDGPFSPSASLPLGFLLAGDQTAHGQKPVLPMTSSRVHAAPCDATTKTRFSETFGRICKSSVKAAANRFHRLCST